MAVPASPCGAAAVFHRVPDAWVAPLLVGGLSNKISTTAGTARGYSRARLRTICPHPRATEAAALRSENRGEKKPATVAAVFRGQAGAHLPDRIGPESCRRQSARRRSAHPGRRVLHLHKE